MTIGDVLNFCNEFDFCDHYNLERVIKLNHIRDSVISISIKCDYIKDYEIIGVFDVLDNISLMVQDGKVKKLVQEVNNLRVVLLQLLCLDKLYKEDKRDGDGNHGKKESFQNKKWF